jgi:hypothetical protein
MAGAPGPVGRPPRRCRWSAALGHEAPSGLALVAEAVCRAPPGPPSHKRVTRRVLHSWAGRESGWWQQDQPLSGEALLMTPAASRRSWLFQRRSSRVLR